MSWAYNIIYMMEREELPISEKENLLATYFSGLFRSMRFGIDAAHGKGAAIQYSFFREAGAAVWDEDLQRFELDYLKLEQAISDLTAKFVQVQGDGRYDGARRFIKSYAKLDQEAETVLNNLSDIPVDIRPVYGKEI